MSRRKRIYIVIVVKPNEVSKPLASTKFKTAYNLAKSVGEINQLSLNYKPALNRIRKNGLVGMYDTTRCRSEDEARITGYVSIEEITLYTS